MRDPAKYYWGGNWATFRRNVLRDTPFCESCSAEGRPDVPAVDIAPLRRGVSRRDVAAVCAHCLRERRSKGKQE